jgi:hypothetical protein
MTAENDLHHSIVGHTPSDHGSECSKYDEFHEPHARGPDDALRMIPIELAIHAPSRFEEIFGFDADLYLRELGLDPARARREGVALIATGYRSHVLKRDWRAREESFLRTKIQRELMEVKSKCQMARRRVTRLKRAFREVIELADSGKLRKNNLRWRFRKALRRSRRDGDLAVSSEREMLDRYAGDMKASCEVLAEVG